MASSVKRVLLTAGAILSFITLFALFGLIFYQLFKPEEPTTRVPAGGPSNRAHQQFGTPSSYYNSGRQQQPVGRNGQQPKSSSGTEIASATVPTSKLKKKKAEGEEAKDGVEGEDETEAVSDWDQFKRLWQAKAGKERAQLLVSNVNMNANSSWTGRVNPHTIGLKPLSELLNITQNFDLMNATFMMDPQRLANIEQHMAKVFYPLYDRHLRELESCCPHPLPDRFTATQRWRNCAHSILRVRDQGGCGSCWALAAVSVISDRTCIASNGTQRDGLSAQQLVECCEYCGGCTGAPNSFFPFLFWYQTGLVSDQCFPYSIARDCGFPCPPSEFEHPRGLGNCSLERQRKCVVPGLKPTRHRAKYVYKLGSLDRDDGPYFPLSLFRRLTAKPERFNGKIKGMVDLLKRELMAHGPVMLCFSVFESFMHYYEGVYNFDLQPGEMHVYDHCAKVIGWGRRHRPNGAPGATQQEYLLVVNSWSSLWAKDGTFKVDLDRLSHFHSDLFAGLPASQPSAAGLH